VAALPRTGNPQATGLTALELVLREACATKEEAIKLLAERLAALGRARDPRALEDAIWAREETYPTGVGFGFAVPHCKTAAVDSASLAVLRLATPVAWGGIDDQPVDCLILLATRDQDGGQEHLRVFARLARKLMDPAFRSALREAPAAQDVLALLENQILTPL
jgi:fructose-specific PTS system IIA-like component